MTDKAQTARDAIANCLLMGRGVYPSPEEWADAVLKRLAHEGFVVVPREATDAMMRVMDEDNDFVGSDWVWKTMVETALKEQAP